MTDEEVAALPAEFLAAAVDVRNAIVELVWAELDLERRQKAAREAQQRVIAAIPPHLIVDGDPAGSAKNLDAVLDWVKDQQS